jgi:hypothetical protein
MDGSRMGDRDVRREDYRVEEKIALKYVSKSTLIRSSPSRLFSVVLNDSV